MTRTGGIFFVFFFLAAFCCVVLIGAEKYSLTIDATKQMAPPAQARGPFPRSVIPDYVPDVPLKIELSFPTGEMRSDGNVLMDFIITNTGQEPMQLPCLIHQPSLFYQSTTDVLTLFFTADADAIGVSDAGKKPNVASNGLMGRYWTSVELYGKPDDPQSYHLLAPRSSILVHASSRLRLRPGAHSFVGHAELVRISGGTSHLIGLVDSARITKRLSQQHR